MMENLRFEIVYVSKMIRKNSYVLARILDKDAEFALTENSCLGEVPVKPILTQPRALDAQGNLRRNLYAFIPRHKNDLNKLQEGRIVELIL